MALTLRPTGGPSRVYQHRQDWTIFDDGKPVGRIYVSECVRRPTLVLVDQDVCAAGSSGHSHER